MEEPGAKNADVKEKFAQGVESVKSGFAGFMSKKNPFQKKATDESTKDVLATIEKLAKLKDMGVITQEEFDEKKTELLAKI